MLQPIHTRTTSAVRLTTVLATLLAAVVVLGGPAVGATAAPTAVSTDQVPAYEVVGASLSEDALSPVTRGMNETGTIVGWRSWPLEAFVWNQETGTTLLPGLAGDTHRIASDVNDAGTVVGHSGYDSIEPPQLAVRWVEGVPQSLGTLPDGEHSHAEAVNEAGTVVGWSMVGSSTHAFVWTESGGMIDITPSAFLAEAYDVNEAGQVTGYVGGQAFVWADGVLTSLGVPAGFAYSTGYAINDAGVVSATVTSPTGISERLARWTPGLGWEVLGGDGERNLAWGLNEHGQVVGQGRPGGVVHVQGAGVLSLTTLVIGDWTIHDAVDIDDAGRIAARGSNRVTGEMGALLLEPVGDPLDYERLQVRLRGSPDPTSALATLEVVDESGEPVPAAVVEGSWSRDGENVVESDTARTDDAGRARLRQPFDQLASGEALRFCLTKISHADHSLSTPSGNGSCATVIVP